MGIDRVRFAPKNMGSDIIAMHVNAVQNTASITPETERAHAEL